MHLILEQIKLQDNKENDNTFDIFYNVTTKLIHAFENDVPDDEVREFVYRLVDTVENISKNHREEILEYCLAAVLPTDSVGFCDIIVHGKYLERVIMDVEQAKQVLTDAGFYVGNLWSIQDIQGRFKCDDDTAQEILSDALTNEWIVEQIRVTITQACEHIGLEEIKQVN
jgi:hypothetical protein